MVTADSFLFVTLTPFPPAEYNVAVFSYAQQLMIYRPAAVVRATVSSLA